MPEESSKRAVVEPNDAATIIYRYHGHCLFCSCRCCCCCGDVTDGNNVCL